MERSRATGAVLIASALFEAWRSVRRVRRMRRRRLGLALLPFMLAGAAYSFWLGLTMLTAVDELEGVEFAIEPIDEF